MKLIINETDVTNALIERPNIVLENQRNDRFSIVTSISNLKLKKNILPSIIYDAIINRELQLADLYNDINQKIFSGYINGNGIVHNIKSDQLQIQILSLLYLPKEIDFKLDETMTIRNFLDRIKETLNAKGLWKSGSIEELYFSHNLRFHYPLKRLWDYLNLFGLESGRITLGRISWDGGINYVDGFKLTDEDVLTTVYFYFDHEELVFVTQSSIIFIEDWFTIPIQDKGTQKQVLLGMGNNAGGEYYLDKLPTENFTIDDMLYVLMPIYWKSDYDTWEDINYHFTYAGKLSEAMIDLAMLTDSKIYYDENGIGFIVFQNYSSGVFLLNDNYILNKQLRYQEENLSDAINFKGVEIDDTILKYYQMYYQQRAFYEKRFYTQEIEVYQYSGIDEVKIFTDLTNFGDVLKIEKKLHERRYNIVVK